MAVQYVRPLDLAQKKYFDLTTYEKIHKHLSDINDTITDEDIRNVKIGIPEENQTEIKENYLSAKKEKK